MRGLVILVGRYLIYYRSRTALLVACLGLTIYLPLAAELVVQDFQRQLVARAATTPLLLGARGSRFDLALHALYFEAEPTATLTSAEVEQVTTTGWATPIPLLIRQKARGFPIVGTSSDYLEFRRLGLSAGRSFLYLGECVVGAHVARKLQLKVEDKLLSDPENLFDIAGAYPLKMHVVGVLAESHSPDDGAVFVDLKTAWILEGIGHGHQNVADESAGPGILNRTAAGVVAGAALPQYTEITPENRDTFHFHGEPSQFPLTAIIAVPHDAKSATLLQGRYLDPSQATQALQPLAVVSELLDLVFRIKRFFDLTAWLLITVTVLFLVLVLSLSLRLRQRELQTMFKLGCSRFTIFRLQTMELIFIISAATLLATPLAWATVLLTPRLLRMWLS